MKEFEMTKEEDGKDEEEDRKKEEEQEAEDLAMAEAEGGLTAESRREGEGMPSQSQVCQFL